MSKFLSFSGAGLKFLLPIDNIVELYNAAASPEPINKVMVGEEDEVYWRGVLSDLLDINILLGIESANNKNCFIICKGAASSSNYCILKVDAIDELVEKDKGSFRLIEIDNPALMAIADHVCIMPGNDQLFYLMHELNAIFADRKNRSISCEFQSASREN